MVNSRARLAYVAWKLGAGAQGGAGAEAPHHPKARDVENMGPDGTRPDGPGMGWDYADGCGVVYEGQPRNNGIRAKAIVEPVPCGQHSARKTPWSLILRREVALAASQGGATLRARQ